MVGFINRLNMLKRLRDGILIEDLHFTILVHIMRSFQVLKPSEKEREREREGEERESERERGGRKEDRQGEISEGKNTRLFLIPTTKPSGKDKIHAF